MTMETKMAYGSIARYSQSIIINNQYIYLQSVPVVCIKDPIW